MATQTRRTIRRSATFFKTTVKASMVTACCGLVLWSAVAAHAAAVTNGLPVNGVPTNGLPTNGVPLNGLPANEGSLPAAQSERLPWSTLSQRPLGETAAPSMRDSRDPLPVALPEVR